MRYYTINEGKGINNEILSLLWDSLPFTRYYDNWDTKAFMRY